MLQQTADEFEVQAAAIETARNGRRTACATGRCGRSHGRSVPRRLAVSKGDGYKRLRSRCTALSRAADRTSAASDESDIGSFSIA